jgi:hypothetical protein
MGTWKFFADFGYLPLLHTLVEERDGERKPFFDSSSPFPPPTCVRRGDESPALSLFSQEFEMRALWKKSFKTHLTPQPFVVN